MKSKSKYKSPQSSFQWPKLNQQTLEWLEKTCREERARGKDKLMRARERATISQA